MLAYLNLTIGAALVAATGCTPSPVQTPRIPAPEEAAVERTPTGLLAPDLDTAGDNLRFTARLTIDAQPGGKKSQAVWLQREDGDRERFVIAYHPHAVWRPFDGLRVEVVGQVYEPRGQALGATHLRVLSLSAAEGEAQTDPQRVGPELELRGRFTRQSGEAGSKSEGSSWLVLETTGGGTYLIEGKRPEAEEVGPQVVVIGRAVEPSPFKTRLGGRYVWILEIRRAPADRESTK